MPSPIMVVLASDNRHLLDQARAGLAAERAIKVVGEARVAGEAIQLVSRRRPRLFIVDLALPPAGGLPVLAQVRKRSPKTKVLAIDDRLDKELVLRVAKAGGYGYMLEEAIPAYLAKAARVMAAGEVWLSRKLMALVVGELQRLVRLPGRAGPRRGRIGPRS